MDTTTEILFEECLQWEAWVIKVMEEMERKELKRLKKNENQPKKKRLQQE